MMNKLKCWLLGHKERHRMVEMSRHTFDEEGRPITVPAQSEERIDCERCGAFYAPVLGKWFAR